MAIKRVYTMKGTSELLASEFRASHMRVLYIQTTFYRGMRYI